MDVIDFAAARAKRGLVPYFHQSTIALRCRCGREHVGVGVHRVECDCGRAFCLESKTQLRHWWPKGVGLDETLEAKGPEFIRWVKV